VRAFVITGPGHGAVQDVDPPSPAPGQVVVDIERAGVCGTDMEFFTGHMAYLRTGEARYPIRIGHEWCGVVARSGDEASAAWVGQRVIGDTMLGCGRCRRCLGGRQHLCAERFEIGVRGGWPGALAEQLLVPASALHALPAGIGPVTGALVEPGGNALRAVRAALAGPAQTGTVHTGTAQAGTAQAGTAQAGTAQAGTAQAGTAQAGTAQAGTAQTGTAQTGTAQTGTAQRLLVMGPGTIGLLAAQIARSLGAEVHLLGRDEPSLRFARDLGLGHTWLRDTLPGLPFDAVLDASTAAGLPSLAAEIVEPGGRVAYIGLSAEPSPLDTRTLVLKDITATGVLSASGGLAETISLYASGAVDPRPVVAATVGLDDVAEVLAGHRPPDWGGAPKIHVDPRC
jgi:threonine dehydrogenase-like Zn-dependent dehydrogenase